MSTSYTATINGAFDLKGQFTQKLWEIEQRHLDWFKKRPAIFDFQDYDSIGNHTFREEDGEYVRFNFWKHSELPENIQTECLLAFEEVYGGRISA
ncbi:hypothetical protein [uncultured Mucilaginibacter sp.]|uniref:hypothetical protein n=1 Tax=uncultured Mucilaginibacter sp. TaxID=797541 RepID=UPI0025CDD685|nr:hypothetical protein [uncultured Mucilaginibacter sp.]